MISRSCTPYFTEELKCLSKRHLLRVWLEVLHDGVSLYNMQTVWNAQNLHIRFLFLDVFWLLFWPGSCLFFVVVVLCYKLVMSQGQACNFSADQVISLFSVVLFGTVENYKTLQKVLCVRQVPQGFLMLCFLQSQIVMSAQATCAVERIWIWNCLWEEKKIAAKGWIAVK